MGGAGPSSGRNHENPVCLHAGAALALIQSGWAAPRDAQTEPAGGKRIWEAGGGGVCRSVLRLALMNMRTPPPAPSTGVGDRGAAEPLRHEPGGDSRPIICLEFCWA